MDNQTLIANAALQIKNLNFDISVYPVRAQGTTDGVQWSIAVETIKAATDVELMLFKTEDFFERLEGKLAWVHYLIDLQLKAGTATADLKWKLQARNKDGTWTDMCAEQPADNVGTAYVAKTIKGYLDIKANITQIPFEMRIILQSNESKSSVTGTDIAFVDGGAGEDTITRTAADFVTAGFVAGDIITISGSASNDGNYTILSVVAGTINVATASLTAEGAGASVTIASTGQATGQIKNTTLIHAVGGVVGVS